MQVEAGFLLARLHAEAVRPVFDVGRVHVAPHHAGEDRLPLRRRQPIAWNCARASFEIRIELAVRDLRNRRIAPRPLEEEAGHLLVQHVAFVHPAERDLVALDELLDIGVADGAGLHLEVDRDLIGATQRLPAQVMLDGAVLAAGIVHRPCVVLRKRLLPGGERPCARSRDRCCGCRPS